MALVADLNYRKPLKLWKGGAMTMSNKSFSIKENPYMKDIQGGEKKVMKKILSVALSTAMAFSMFASVAFGADTEKLTPEQQFNVLKEAGIVDGFPDGLAHLDQTVTRAQLAKIIVKSLALEEVTGVATYKDKNYTAKHWAAPFIEAATKAGILEGVSTNPANPLFNPTGNVSVQELAKVLVVANKLEVPTEANNTASEWAKGYVAAAIKAGYIAEGINYQASATRAQTVVAAHAIYEFNNFKVTKAEAIDANNVKLTLSTGEVVEVKLEKALEANKATELTYKAKDGRELKYTVTYVVTAATKIESVTADNLKELTVKFDGDVDKKTAENEANYKVTGVTSFESATLSADKKEVKLLVAANGGKFVNQKELTLEIKGVKNANASKTFSEKVKFTAIDNQLPTVSEAKALGTKAIKVVFSEPVTELSAANLANYRIDGKAISGSVKFNYPNIAFISTDVAVGEHKLSVQSVEDFHVFKVSPVELDITVVEDTTAPEITSIKSTDLTKVEVEFNEPVKSVKKAYQTSSTRTADVKINDNKVTLTFSDTNKLSLADTTIYLEGVTDYSNNSADRNSIVKPELDTTRPEVTAVTSEAKETNTEVTVEFSKDVNATDIANKENYVLRNDKGEVVNKFGFNSKGNPILAVKYAQDSKGNDVKNKVVLTSVGKIDSGKYSLEVFSIRDNASIGNTLIPVKVEFNVTQSSALEVSSVWYKGTTEEDTLIYVQFNKALATSGTGNAEDINKYSYIVSDLADLTATGANPQYYPFSSEFATARLYSADTVVITVPTEKISNFVTATKNTAKHLHIRAVNVADINDNRLSVSNKEIKEENASVIGVKEIKATDKKTIKVTLESPISYVSTSDFTITGVSSTSYTATLNSDDNKVIDIVYTTEVIPESTAGIRVEVGAGKDQTAVLSHDNYNRKLKKDLYTVVKDGIAPVINSNPLALTDAKTIVIGFTEGVVGDSQQVKDSFTVSVGDKTADIDTVVVSGSSVTITLAENTKAGDRILVSYTNNGYLTDAARNKVDGFVASYQAPTPDAPTGLTPTAVTAAGNDGKISGLDTTKSYEFKLLADTVYSPVTAGSTEITGLSAGTYQVRIVATGTTPASQVAQVVVAAN